MKWLTMIMLLTMVVQFIGITQVKAASPDLVIEQVQISTSSVSKGTTFTVTFNLRNTTTDKDFEDIYISMPTTNSNFSIVNKGNTFLAAANLAQSGTVLVSMTLLCNDVESNKIPIVLNYLEGAVAQTPISEQILVTLADTTPTEKVDTTKYKPELVVTAGDIQTIEAGTTKKMSITLKNNSSFLARNVIIIPTLSEAMNSEISLNQAAIMPTNGEIKNNSEQILEFSLTANGITKAGTYPLTYKVQYQNSYNDTYTASLVGYIKVTQPNNNSSIYISSLTLNPLLPVRDDKLDIKVTLKNRMVSKASNISVWIEGLSQESFTYQEQTVKKSTSMLGNDSANLTFRYLVKEKASSGNYPYKVFVSYTDASGNTIRLEQEYLLNLPADGTLKGALEIMNLRVPSVGVAPEKQFVVSFDVVNTGGKDIENVLITLNNSTSIWAQSSSVVQIKKLTPGETKTVSYTLIASKSADTINLPVSFSIQYDDEAGEEIQIKTLTQSLGVLVKGDKESTTKPKILINSVATNPLEIIPGKAFELKLSFINTSTLKGIQNVKMTLSSIDSTSQTSNIVPIGQSDSIFIGNISPQTETSAVLNLMIPSTYKGNVCDIKFAFTYEDVDGTAYDDTETIHLPISESVQLTVSDVRLGKVLTDGYSIELDFYNTGKGTLKNLMVDLDGEFDSVNSNYYVGDLLAGRMDIYSVRINGLPTEEIMGEISFTYEDGLGNLKELKVPVDLTYQPDETTLIATEAMSTEVKKTGFAFGLLIPVLVLLAVVGIVIVRKKRKAV